MEIKNLTGLERPLEKLVETISQGAGVLGNHLLGFDVAKAKRIGEVEAENKKKGNYYGYAKNIFNHQTRCG